MMASRPLPDLFNKLLPVVPVQVVNMGLSGPTMSLGALGECTFPSASRGPSSPMTASHCPWVTSYLPM